MPKPWDEHMIMAKVHEMINNMYEEDPTPWDAYIKSREEPKVDPSAGITDDIRAMIDSVLNGEES